jgi:Zn-dependent peptidase ImmA (M78 family)
MKYYSRKAIESLATTIRHASSQLTIPIDVEEVAKHLGVRVLLEGFSDDLSGVLVRRKGESPTIAVNSSHSPLRRRFTIAHECGHLVLEHEGEVFVDKHILNRRDKSSSLAVDEQEVQANQFAASLLMPRDEVVRHMERFMQSYHSHSDLVDVMASAFRVSRSAMEVRLINLGLTSPVDDF